MNILRLEHIQEPFEYSDDEQFDEIEQQLVTELDAEGKPVEVLRDVVVTKTRQVMREGVRTVSRAQVIALSTPAQEAFEAGRSESKAALAARLILDVKARAKRDQEVALLAAVADEIRVIEELAADPQKQISDLQALETSR